MPDSPREHRFATRPRGTPRAPFRLGVLVVAALVTLVLPCAAGAQSPAPDEGFLPGSPLSLLIERREALQLTSDQLVQLKAIQEQVAVTNEPLVGRMMNLRARWQQERRTARRGGNPPNEARIERLRDAAQRTRTQIQRNNRMAMQEVNRLLTPTQRARVRGIVEERRRQRPAKRAGSGPDTGDGR